MKLGLRALRGALVVSLLSSLAVPLVANQASAVAPAGLTTLVEPADGATVGGNPTFTWTAVPGALKYRMQVSRSELFDLLVYNVDTYNVHATPPTALPIGALYWRVAPTDGGSGVGTYSTAAFTRVWADAPTPLSPAAEATLTYPDDPLLFKWEPLAGAKTYNVQIDDDVNFISPTVSTVTNNTSYTLLDPQTNDQQFYWRVQGVSGSVVSPWSEPRTYHVEWPTKPTLTYPGVGETVTDVVLRWTPVSGAATYQVQVSPNPDFTNNITFDVPTKGTSYSPPTTLLNGSYFWRVRARDAHATPNLGAWSSDVEMTPGVFLPAQFTRAWSQAPTLLSPANEDYDVTTPTLQWTAVPYASHYEIWIGGESNFTPGSYLTCYTNQTSFTPYTHEGGTTPAVPGACGITESTPGIGNVAYWKVRGIDSPAGILGIFSTTSAFMLKHTAMVVPLSPANAATLTGAPVLRWEPVLGVAKYSVTILANGSKISGAPFTTYSDSYTPVKLTAGTTYSWYVQTLDDAGRAGVAPNVGAYWTFTYEPAVATELDVTLLTPDDGAGSPVMPSMSWNPVAEATSYKVYYGVAGTGVVSLLGTTEVPAYTHPGLPPTPATYAWLVEAYGTGGVFLGSSFGSTFVMQSLPLVSGVSPANCTVEVVCVSAPETPKLEWTPTAYTGGYLVYLANDAAFTNVVRIYQTQYPTLTPRESLLDNVAGQAYYWFVRPCRTASGNGGCGAFDNSVFPTAWAFRKRSLPVEPLTPADGATATQDITFTWAEYAATNAAAAPPSTQGARRYRIQVSTVADFATTLDTQDVDQTTYTPHDRTYPEGPLYWRVGAIDGSSNQLTYSAARQVVKATPGLTPLHPLPGATVAGTPYFQWSAQPHVAKYELEVYKNGDDLFSPSNKVTLPASSTRLTAYTPTSSLPAGTYAWRVRRMDANTITPGARPGPWSSGGVFTVASTPPTLVSPAQGTVFTGSDVLFTWTPVTGAAQYRFEASGSSGFGSLIDSTNTVMSAWAPTVKYNDGVIHWRVKVLDAADNVIAVSAPSTVVKDGTAPTVTAKTPTTNGPVAAGSSYSATFSEAVIGLSATTFTMKVTSSGALVPGTVTPDATTPGTSATFKPSGHLIPGETYTLTLTDGVQDLNGNHLVPVSWTLRASTTVDGLSPVVQEFWDRDTYASASGGGYLASRTPGAKLSHTFTGTSVSLLGRRAVDGGYGEVWLDGVKQATATFYATANQWKVPVWTKTGLANTTHKVEVRVLGSKPSASSAPWVYVDAFKVGTSVVEETSALVVQAHKTVNLAGAMNGSYQLNIHTASGDNGSQPYFLLRFKGTGVQWRGVRATAGGRAGVYIDNVGKATIDTYGAASSGGTTLYSISGLTNAVHTVKIVVTGVKSTSSSGYNVTVDSFTVV